MTKTLASRLESYFPQPILELLRKAGGQAEKSGQKIYLVGGVVRDIFLGRVNLDFDLVVEGDAIELAQKLAKSCGVSLVVHPRFVTAKLNFTDFSLDLATARRETYKCPGALPDVQPGSIAEDLFRRDFSINAMALFLNPKRFGELIDIYNGQDDIKNCLIRVLHVNSFRDDATRIFRAFRYEQRLGFSLESHTAKLLERNIGMLKTISGDRLRHELMLTLMEEFPERVLIRAGQFGVLKELHCSLSGDEWLTEKFKKARLVQKRSSLIPLYLNLLIYRLTRNQNDEFLGRLNFSKTLAEAMRQTLVLKNKLNFLEERALKSSDVYQMLHQYPIPAVEANMLAAQSDIIKKRIRLYLTKLRNIKPILNGEYLKQIGVFSGPELGKMLNSLRKAKLDGEVRTKADEERLVLNLLRKRSKHV